MKIGVCGTGRMGSAIAQRLMSLGREVGIWNRNSAKAKPLVEAGAKLFASSAELVESCDVTIVMLLNDAATEAVYHAPNGILTAKLAGKLLIDMSTIRPDTMTSNGSAALQQGAGFVECPVGGTVDRQGSGRGANGRNRVRPQCGNERPGLCGPGRRGHSCRTSRHRKRARLLRGSGSCGPWRYGCDRDFDPLDPAQRQVVVASAFQSSGIIHLTLELVQMIDRKNRYGRTAARINDADGLARRPSSTTVDIHAHIVVPQAAKLAQPHVDISRVPLAYFSDAATKEVNAQQEKDVSQVMTAIDRS